MKKKILVLFLIIVTALTGCGGEKGGNSENNTVGETKNNQGINEVQDNVLVTDKVCDKFSRIAVTFYGDTATQMGLSWYTPNEEFYGNDVEVYNKKTLEKLSIEYEVETGVAEYDESSAYHQTVLLGLTKNTEYYFRVGDESSNEWSQYGSFKTGAPDLAEYKFVAVTDTQSEHLPDAFFSADTMELALMTAGDAAFIMHSGDFVDNGDKEYLWLAQMNSAESLLMNNIISVAAGNHEGDDNSFWQHFKLEKNNGSKTKGVYYSYDYGSVHYVVLNTNKKNSDGTSYIDDDQLAWLDADLKAAREDGAEWIIVNMHRGMYTLGDHALGEMYDGEDGMRKRVGAVLEKYNVELVIQGHDHCPSVTKPIIDGSEAAGGVVYINTGSAGSKSYAIEENLPGEYRNLFAYMPDTERVKDTYQNFAVISVTKEALKVTMYEQNLLKTSDRLYVTYEVEIKK